MREGMEVAPLLSGGSGGNSYEESHPAGMPERLEAGTLNGPGIAGLGAALSWLEQKGLDAVRERELALMRRFYQGVSEVPEVKVYGDFTLEMRAPIVALNIGAYDSSEVSDALSQEYGIVTRAGAHCAPLMHEALGTREQGAVRFSFSCFNTEEEVDFAVRAVEKLARE